MNHFKNFFISFVFVTFFLISINGCQVRPLVTGLSQRESVSMDIETAEAFDRLLTGIWETSSGAIVKYVNGTGILISPSKSVKELGFVAGEIFHKDYQYIGDNQFRFLSKWRFEERQAWTRCKSSVTAAKLYIEYIDRNPFTGAARTERNVYTILERQSPPKPDLSLDIVYSSTVLKPNSLKEVTVEVHNKGEGYARNVIAKVHASKDIKGLYYEPEVVVGNIPSHQTRKISIPMKTDNKIQKGNIPFTVEITDGTGNVTSKSFTITTKDAFERGLPPNLFAELSFEDDNGNGILEAEESAEIQLTISNRGKGKAQALNIFLEDNLNDNSLESESAYVPIIEPGVSHTVTIPIRANLDIKTAEHKLKINVTEHFGFDMDPAYLILNTAAYQKPELVFSGLEILDSGEDTAAIVQDGRLQAGELVKAKIVVQNIGQGTAEDTKYIITSEDKNIYVENNRGRVGNMQPGEVKEFWVTITPNKRVRTEEKLPLYMSLREKYGKGSLDRYQLPIQLNIRPPQTNMVTVKQNIESLRTKIARFEYKSSKFKINVGRLVDIKNIEQAKTKRKNSLGVVIGIENYEELPPAPYATNDADLMKEYFKKRLGVEQVVLYKNDEMSGFKFDDIFNPDYGDLQKAIVKGKTELFVYYSGHGVPNKSSTEIYLFPYDGKLASLNKRGFSMNRFFDYLSKLETKNVTVILDACFSGGSKASAKISTQNLVAMKGMRLKVDKPWLWYKNFTVINSSNANETSLGYDDAECGLFTYYVCAGLKGCADANNDRKITLGELKEYVTRNVMDTSKKIIGLQTPEFYGDENQILVIY